MALNLAVSFVCSSIARLVPSRAALTLPSELINSSAPSTPCAAAIASSAFVVSTLVTSPIESRSSLLIFSRPALL